MEQHQIVSREEWLERRIPLLNKRKPSPNTVILSPPSACGCPGSGSTRTMYSTVPMRSSVCPICSGAAVKLYVKHFMMGPEARKHQCVGCSPRGRSHHRPTAPFLEHHDVSYAAVARAPIDEIEVVRERMGLAVPLGLLVQQRLQLRLPGLLQAGRGRRRARRVQLPAARRSGPPRCGTCRAAAFSTRARPARSSTRTRPMAAAAKRRWEFTAFLTQCRKGGTKLAPIIR